MPDTHNVPVVSLTGAALSWAVARAEGDELPRDGSVGLDYATDWLAAGPIIEREGISVRRFTNETFWVAYISSDGAEWSHGRTALEAAMRAYVEHKLGALISLPDTLRSGGSNEQA